MSTRWWSKSLGTLPGPLYWQKAKLKSLFWVYSKTYLLGSSKYIKRKNKWQFLGISCLVKFTIPYYKLPCLTAKPCNVLTKGLLSKMWYCTPVISKLGGRRTLQLEASLGYNLDLFPKKGEEGMIKIQNFSLRKLRKLKTNPAISSPRQKMLRDLNWIHFFLTPDLKQPHTTASQSTPGTFQNVTWGWRFLAPSGLY